MKELFRHLIVGPEPLDYRYAKPAVQTQCENVLKIWRNTHDFTFGIERLVRLFLASSAFLFPSLYIRHWSGLGGMLRRKLVVEAYVTFKFFLPILVLWLGLEQFKVFRICAIYFGFETLFYILGLLFLSDIYVEPISRKRSYLMTSINFMEMNLDFAVLYKGMVAVEKIQTSLDAIYFSCVTAFTVGYGDLVPTSDWGKRLVIAQSISSLIFITLVFARLVGAFEQNNARFQAKKPHPPNAN